MADDRAVAMSCVCETVFQLAGNEADQYAFEHLVERRVDPIAWTVTYQCPDTGRTWLRDSPHPELQGGGPPRLRQVDQSGSVIEAGSVDPYR
jgi:hypothetical protein